MTQHEQIIEIHSDGRWHCSTEIEFMRDQRKRISELNLESFKKTGQPLLEAKPCNGSCGKKHNSRLFMRRLIGQNRAEIDLGGVLLPEMKNPMSNPQKPLFSFNSHKD